MTPPTQTDASVVLLVEDEPLVRMLGLDVLEEAGFEVVEATNADEAIRALQARSDVRVLFTDVDMPGGSMNGFELARRVHRDRPEIAVLIVSGKTGPGPGDMPPGGHFVGKPYQPDAIVRQIRRMTAETG